MGCRALGGCLSKCWLFVVSGFLPVDASGLRWYPWVIHSASLHQTGSDRWAGKDSLPPWAQGGPLAGTLWSSSFAEECCFPLEAYNQQMAVFTAENLPWAWASVEPPLPPTLPPPSDFSRETQIGSRVSPSRLWPPPLLGWALSPQVTFVSTSLLHKTSLVRVTAGASPIPLLRLWIPVCLPNENTFEPPTYSFLTLPCETVVCLSW